MTEIKKDPKIPKKILVSITIRKDIWECAYGLFGNQRSQMIENFLREEIRKKKK